jgi:hypothetical protein
MSDPRHGRQHGGGTAAAARVRTGPSPLLVALCGAAEETRLSSGGRTSANAFALRMAASWSQHSAPEMVVLPLPGGPLMMHTCAGATQPSTAEPIATAAGCSPAVGLRALSGGPVLAGALPQARAHLRRSR